ncbi:MAG: portal protein, partial [bacterium]
SMQMRQESSIAVLFILFDNYNESRYLSTEMLMSLIQQYVTEEEVIRIEGPNGWQLLQINSQINRQNEGFNDITAAEFDLIIDEEAQSKSTRLAIAKMLTDFSQNNPGTIPPDIILEYASIPFSVKQRIREYMAEMRAWELKKIEKEIELKNAGKQGGTADGSK